MPLEEVVKRVPFFGYQMKFASGELEKVIRTKREIRQFLLSMYGGRTPNREVGFDVMTGPLLDKLPDLQASPLLSEEVRSSPSPLIYPDTSKVAFLLIGKLL